MFDKDRMPDMYILHREEQEDVYVTEDAIMLARAMNKPIEYTAEIMQDGWGYWLTWLTEEEAKILHARAYLRPNRKE